MSLETRKSSTFPVEIYERIIDRIPFYGINNTLIDFQDVSREYALLCACALTCRAWVPRSRLNLFRFISIKSDITIKHLLASLNFQPRNGDLVELVQIWHGAAITPMALHLAKRLKNLKRMEFVNTELTKINTSTFFFLSKFRSITEIGFQSTTFDSFSEFTKFATAFPNVKKVYLKGRQTWGSSFDQKPFRENPPTRRFKPTQLRMEFDMLEAMESPCQWLGHTGARNSLSEIDIGGGKCGEREMKAIQELLNACGSSVRRLSLALFPDRGRDFASLPDLNLETNTSLTTLTITHMDLEDLDWLAGVLSTIHAPTLRTLYFAFSVYGWASPDDLSDAPWEEMDELFNEDRFIGLERMFWRIRSSTKSIKFDMKELLPETAKRVAIEQRVTYSGSEVT